jgi:hypothetical protein
VLDLQVQYHHSAPSALSVVALASGNVAADGFVAKHAGLDVLPPRVLQPPLYPRDLVAPDPPAPGPRLSGLAGGRRVGGQTCYFGRTRSACPRTAAQRASGWAKGRWADLLARPVREMSPRSQGSGVRDGRNIVDMGCMGSVVYKAVHTVKGLLCRAGHSER